MAWPHRIFASQFTDFELKLLRVFRAVVDCGGFSPAEVEIGLTKSAISKHVSDLEIRLGVRLCERGRGGFAVTPEGKIVYDSTTQLLVALEEFRSQVNAFHSELLGELYVGCIDSFVTSEGSLMPTILADYVAAHPGVRFNMIVGSASEMDRAVEERRLHIAVSVGGNSVKVVSVPLLMEFGYLYCGRSHPLFDVPDAEITDEMLSRHALVQHAYSIAEKQLVADLALRVCATSHQSDGILFLILAGHHIGFLPSHYAEAWVAKGAVRAIRPQDISKRTEISLKAQRASLSNPMVGTFIEIARRRASAVGRTA
jgi:DNA-binding transcriptional LysR family regulator